MTRFIYLADTHLGANPIGYHQQPAYPERLPDIVAALRAYIRREGDIAFVLHGGDLIDQTTDENIRSAAKLFALPVPVYLCLGNHDLTSPDALARWLELAPQFFPGRRPEFTIPVGEAVIHVVPNHWDEQPYYWTGPQAPHFREDQLNFLASALSEKTDRLRILSTHSPVHGVPPHAPPAEFTACVDRYTDLAYVLGAHNHLHTSCQRNGVRYVTVAALVETPFEFNVFTVANGAVTMATVSLSPWINIE